MAGTRATKKDGTGKAKARTAAAGKGEARAAAPKNSDAPAAPAADGGGKAAPLRMRDLVAEVAARSGAAKREIKPVIEAALAILGEALAADRQLALPPFGKARVNRHRDSGSGETLTVKLRRPGARSRAGANEPLAGGGE